jgi:hypothetical protein
VFPRTVYAIIGMHPDPQGAHLAIHQTVEMPIGPIKNTGVRSAVHVGDRLYGKPAKRASTQNEPNVSAGTVLRRPRKDGKRRSGGEGGIRTPDTVTRMPHFECGAFNRSATSPHPALAGVV